MLKSKKGSRPEITIVGARPLNDSPFFVDSLTRNLQTSIIDQQKELYGIPGNGLDCFITRTSTLPATRSRDKKQRPKSEIYNGFASLRGTRIAKSDVDPPQKETKKVSRTRSLHAPKKPPRDFSTRPVSTSPCGDNKQLELHIGQVTSITPTRPAPPVPFTPFEKKISVTSPTSKPTDMLSQSEHKSGKTKRTRSKSTSTVSEKQKPRAPAPLPRGKSFNTHSTRKIIKTTQDEDVVILTRANSVEEGKDVKLKSFGVKVSRSTDNVCSKNNVADDNKTANVVPSATATTANGIDVVSSPTENDVSKMTNGCISLSDAIHANAVYTRLQQKSGQTGDSLQTENRSEEIPLDSGPKVRETLSDAINASAVLNKIKHKSEMLSETESNQFDVEKANSGDNCTKDVESKERDSRVGEKRKPELDKEKNDTLLENSNRKKSIDNLSGKDDATSSVEPIASYVVKAAHQGPTNSNNNADGNADGCVKSMPLNGDIKRGTPPAVKPKPHIPKRPSMEKIVLRPLDDIEAEEKRKRNELDEEAKRKSSPLVIKSRNSQAKIFTTCSDENFSKTTIEIDSTAVVKADSENSSRAVEKNESITVEGNESTRTAAHTKEPLAQKCEKENNSNVSERNSAESVCSEAVDPNLTHAQITNEDDDVFHENVTILPRKRSESEVESSGSVDSIASLTSQVTVIFNPDPKPPAENIQSQPGPFESHSNRNRRKPIPAPYSSHPERRPKPAKAPPPTSTLKSKNRRSRSLIGRRLNSSPPSTPPPPPKVDHAEPSQETVEKAKNRPPVPPRAPSMYIQNDSPLYDLRIEEIEGGAFSKAPPPRPVKPPTLKHTSTGENKNSFDIPKAIGVKNSEADHNVSMENSPETLHHNDPKESNGNVFTGDKKPFAGNDSLESPDPRQKPTDKSSETFTKKLEYFKSNVDKTKPTLTKQRSLGSCQGPKYNVEEEHTVSPAQLRREGEEALRIISQLRRENGEVMSSKKKSPVPQKPKRPLSVNMENVVIFDTTEASTDKKTNTLTLDKTLHPRKPPPKPERSPITFKAEKLIEKQQSEGSSDVMKSDTFTEGKPQDIDLRSKDAGLTENETQRKEKKPVPKKPARTSSLRRKDPKPVKIEFKKEKLEVNVKEEDIEKYETMVDLRSMDVTDSGNKIDLNHASIRGDASNSKDVTNKNKKDLSAEAIQNGFTGSKTLTAGRESISNDQNIEETTTEDASADLNVVKQPNRDNGIEWEVHAVENKAEKYGPVDHCNNAAKLKEHDASSDIGKKGMKRRISDALSTQIDQLDRIILETSTVLGEGLSGSFSSDKDSMKPISSLKDIALEDDNVCSRTTSEDSSAGNLHVQNDISTPSDNSANKTDQESKEVPVLGEEHHAEEQCTDTEHVKESNADIAKDNLRNSELLASENSGSSANGEDTTSSDKGQADQGNSVEEVSAISNDVHISSSINEDLSTPCSAKPNKTVPQKPARPTKAPTKADPDSTLPERHGEIIRSLSDTPPDSLATVSQNSVNPPLRQAMSAPERPTLPSLARKARPPIPSILRESDTGNEPKDTSENGLMFNIRKIMDITEPHGIALYDYTSENAKDLQFKAGDVILLERRINSDWYQGSANGKSGMFPLKFIELMVPLPSTAKDLEGVDELLILEKPAALAIYPFVAGNENELTFDSGDTIELLSKNADDSFVGRCNGHEGSFPASFVAIIKPLREGQDGGTPNENNDSEIALANTRYSSSKEDDSKSNSSQEHSDGVEASFNESFIALSSEEALPAAENKDFSNCICTAIADFQSGVEGDLSFKVGQNIRIIASVNEEWLRGSFENKTGIFPKCFVKLEETSNEC